MIIVTGSDGIIGRELCNQFTLSGIPFLPLSHRRKAHTLEKALIVDLTTDLSILHELSEDIEAIVHLAAAVPHSVYYPDTITSANLTKRMDQNIFILQKRLKVPLIYMSTCGLYDRLSQEFKTENDTSLIKVTSPYFEAKACAEKMFLSDGLTSTILRMAAPIGFGLKPNLVLAKFLNAARNNSSIQVWGSGKREQNFIDTYDVAKLIIKILHEPKRGILNVSSLMPTTMLQLAELIVLVVGSGFIECLNHPDPNEGETARYSIEKAKQIYNWEPSQSLENSILKIISEDFEQNK